MKLSGVHHIAVMAKDMKEHINFFSDVMGCELMALFPMHGVPGAIHAFMKLNEHCYFSMVQIERGRDIPIELGITHAGNGGGVSAPGTMQHIAFRAENEEALLALRDRIRSKGYPVIGPLDHGMCKSMYFAGPDQMTLEIACPGEKIDPARWVDPAVIEQIGMTMADAKACMNPEPTNNQKGSVKQPDYDPSKYHQAYPKEIYLKMIGLSDDVMAASVQFDEPPVPAAE